MKCNFKHCKHEDSDELITFKHRKHHPECKIDRENLEKTAELYKKYYNKAESYGIMYNSLHNWFKHHSSEYMLFCMCKAIRAKKPLTNFFSFYYVLNDGNYRELYRCHTQGDKYLSFGLVRLLKSEYDDLVKYIGNVRQLELLIRNLDDYIHKKGTYYSSHYDTLKQWYDKRKVTEKSTYKETIY